MWYLCGLGSNIEPEYNMPKALSLLMDEANWIWISEIIRTEPVGIQTTHYFLNALVVFWSTKRPYDLKRRFNAIEKTLGRDRDDPNRRLKDHTIDMDVIEYSERPWFTGHAITERYFRHLFENHLDEDEIPVMIKFNEFLLGQMPAIIYRADNADKMIMAK